jgi:hypothetical protein
MGGGDTIEGQIGDDADVVASGKNIRQRSTRDSHDTYWGSGNEILQMSVDIKLLQAMFQERAMQVDRLQGWVILIGIAIFLQTISFALLLVRLWR